MKGEFIMLEIVKYVKARYLTEKGQDLVEYALLLAFVVAVGAIIVGNDTSVEPLSYIHYLTFSGIIGI
mgnify:CR=1 FL=1